MSHWLRHWNLNRDPFDDRGSAFVATPGHEEALARLIHAIETASRSIQLRAGAGLGKSRVLARAVDATRSPGRRFARVNGPTDGPDLFARLAQGLGGRVTPGASRSIAWRALGDSIRLARWQGLQVVLIVDDCQGLGTPADRMDLERLDQVDPDPATRLTVIRLARPSEPADGNGEHPETASDWSLSARLEPLTRSETAVYLATKLEGAGRLEPTFTPRAVTRLHATSRGVPRGIDRIAGLALLASAFRGLEMVTPDVVEDAAGECTAVESTLLDF